MASAKKPFSTALFGTALLGAALLGVAPPGFAAPEVSVAGLMPNQVFAVIDGKTRILKVGQTSPEGVTLIAADSQQAQFEIDGKRFSRGLSRLHGTTDSPQTASPTAKPEPARPLPSEADDALLESISAQALADAEQDSAADEARLVRGHNHHYFSTGQINGKAVSFLVDTGAYSIAMGYREADRLGLNWKSGKRIIANTAGGNTPGYEFNLNSVKVGNITLHNVKATAIVAEIDGPILLGMSFMSRVSMREEGNLLVLKKKY